MPATTPNRKLPYPQGPDPFLPAPDIQKLATAVDTDIQGLRDLLRFLLELNGMQRGRASFAAGALPRTSTVTFPSPFKTVPNVFLTIPSEHSTHVQARMMWGQTTTTKCKIQLQAVPGQSNTNLSGTFYVDWLAVGQVDAAIVNDPAQARAFEQASETAITAGLALPAPTAT